ncbi:MAG TPA: right-handed parallel beta-helix repeat-containing protein, partial [Solirubrobacteraceae bacterium]|nr:right-handed parallel beta-helix repeat-containing protein [Solirubrobacteraceae bacterium]
AATAGGVYQLPAGVCATNVAPIPANANAFTLEGATGGPTLLEPSNLAAPIIETGSDVAFSLSGLTFTAASGVVALSLGGSTTPVTLSGDTFTGNLGEGAVSMISQSTQPNVISGDTFSGNTSASDGAALALYSDGAYTVTGNTFTGNADTASGNGVGGGGLAILASGTATNPIQVTNNTFGGPTAGTGNTAYGEGGGAFIAMEHGQALTLTANSFENNRLAGAGTATGSRLGGGLFVGLTSGSTSYNVVQSGNTFLDNTITETQTSPTPGRDAGGAGEWVSGTSVQSTNDRFVGNRVGVNDGLPPEGGGLGVHATAAVGSSPGTPAQPGVFVGRNDLFSGNSTAAGGWGGAVYVGLVLTAAGDCTGSCPGSSLTLDDSTIVANSVDAGTGSQGGAFWGNPVDTLALANSIVYGNTPQPESYGFGASTTTLRYSDVCTESGGPTVPTSAGNICANPMLNADGTETPVSPTLGTGSTALVPAGLATDLAGNPRISTALGCAGSPQAVVDMGAFESASHLPLIVCSPAPALLVVSAVSQSASKWLESNHLATITKAHRKLPVGTTFKFTLSEAATVKLSFEQSVTGRKAGKKCVAKSKHNAKKHRCTITTTAGTLRIAGHAGTNRVRFYGRISAHKKLRLGTYTVAITASTAGYTSKPARLKFTIAGPAHKRK